MNSARLWKLALGGVILAALALMAALLLRPSARDSATGEEARPTVVVYKSPT